MADMIVTPSVLSAALTCRAPAISSSFPALTRSPGLSGYAELLSTSTVIRGRSESGYPVANKQFTFDPKTWRFSLYSVVQADKEIVMDFYEAYKDIPFNWLNRQESVTYEVAFEEPPECSLMGRKDLWQINLTLVQTSPL